MSARKVFDIVGIERAEIEADFLDLGIAFVLVENRHGFKLQPAENGLIILLRLVKFGRRAALDLLVGNIVSRERLGLKRLPV